MMSIDRQALIKKLDHVLKMNSSVMTNTGTVYIKQVIGELSAPPVPEGMVMAVPEAFVELARQAISVNGRERWEDKLPVFQVNDAVITVGDCRAMIAAQTGEIDDEH